MFDSAHDYAIVLLDLDGNVTDWNAGATKILGWRSEEMCGKPADAFFTPEDRRDGIPAMEMQSALEEDLRLGVREGRARTEGMGRGAGRVQHGGAAAAGRPGWVRHRLPLRGWVRAHLEAGTLVRVLEDWCDPFPSYHLYFPSRREPEPALAVLVEALRYRG